MGKITTFLIYFTAEWECRHGAYLGLKYLLCAVNLNRDIIVKLIYPKVLMASNMSWMM